ncbi:AAA family ATPase [Paenibacillus sp. AN1007]|uniref:AAA family ATPase n=1 Tax=Paenibacillus sp. AN1007 TaxID=3151385 RepID=A0AAU8N4Y1_9BACL
MLEKIMINNFGSFETFEMKFNKDITVIVGRNGSGKTQLLGAIAAVFYGRESIRVNSTSGIDNMHISLKFKLSDSQIEVIRSYSNGIFYFENFTRCLSSNRISHLRNIDIVEYEPIIISYKNNSLEFDIDIIKKHLFQLKLESDIIDFFLEIINRVEKTKVKNAYRIYSGGERYILELLGQLSIALEDKRKIILIDEFGGDLDSNSFSILMSLLDSISRKIQVIIVMSSYHVHSLKLEKKSIELLHVTNPSDRNKCGFKYDFLDSILSTRIQSSDSPITKNKIVQYVMNSKIKLEENIDMEFKEVKGINSIDSILSTVDQYVVAYLNIKRNIIGKVLWGISDDRTVMGVKLAYSERDKLRRDVVNKLSQISPPVPSQVYSILLVEVYDEDMKVLEDKYIVEVTVYPYSSEYFFSTGKDEVYIKTDGGKRKLKTHEIQIELKSRR